MKHNNTSSNKQDTMNKLTEFWEKECAIVLPYSVRYLLPEEVEELRIKLTSLAEEYKEYFESYSVDIYVWETMPEEHKNIFISCGLEERMRKYTSSTVNYIEKAEYSEYRHEEERKMYNEIMTMAEPPQFESEKERFRYIHRNLSNIYYAYRKEDPIEKQINDVNNFLQTAIEKLNARDIVKNVQACSRWDILNEQEKRAYELIGKKDELMNAISLLFGARR